MDNNGKISSRGPISSKRLSTKSLVLAAIFVAMNIILSRFGAIMLFNGSVRFSFGNIPLILSGLVLGPGAGAMTGGIADLLGFFINSHGGAFHPGFTLSSILIGTIPGIVMFLSPTKKSSLLNVVVSNISILIIVSLLLNTYWLSQLQGNAYLVLLPARAATSIIITVLNILITYPLVKSLEKTGLILDKTK
ncbi:folate family ECF transporter S component [Alkaliphilus sp. MSJ-5]|uniref:Folate family ECF transporter S component n=1 Tax=Alkaliphilus flagellatus TaxID=2841507 RepID=A0ABS6G3R2_9FIRM|nr:folate family ECF transporter S component [Alkaliphilus flagellatus]MBU5676781.1 folate family ECF transporter S component [Alkaliphilus flagellatus]